jgi:hypothetical protein
MVPLFKLRADGASAVTLASRVLWIGQPCCGRAAYRRTEFRLYRFVISVRINGA